MPFRFLPTLTLTISLCALLPSVLIAQDNTEKDWATLMKEREEGFDRLREIRNEAGKASQEDRIKLVKEYSEIVTNLRDNVLPGLEKGLPKALADKESQEEAKTVAMELVQMAYGSNDYPTCQEICDLILQHDKDNRLAVNLGAVSRFAQHDFADAKKMLEAAEANGDLIQELGGRYLQSATDYVEYWEKEQAIRAAEDAATGEAALPRVKMETSQGDIVLELFENEAPNTVANFISLAESGFYNGLAFHRVIPSFMAQGGCPNSREGNPAPAGTGGPGYNIKCECYKPNARRHFAGSISMAHAGRDTGGSQFFITHLPTPHLDRDVNPSSVHTVFGRVVEGLDVVCKIQKDDVIKKVTVIRKRNHEYKPETIPE